MTVAPPIRNLSWRIATTSLFFGNGLMIGAWAANIPRIKALHGLSDGGLGSLLLTFGLGAVGAMILTGALAARLGVARVATATGVALAFLLPLVALVSGWPLLLAVAIVLGAVSGVQDVAMNAYAAQLERRWGMPIMSSFHAGWSFGGLAGAVLSGVLASIGWGLAATLIAACVVVAITGAAGAILPPLDAPPPAGRTLQLPSRRLFTVSLLAAICFASEGAVADWSGVYLNTVVGTDPAWATTGYTAFALTMVAGRVSGDAVMRRLGAARVIRFGGLLALVGFGVALAIPDRWVVDGGMILVGAGLANVVPAVFSAGGRLAGTAGVAMVSATGYAGLLIAPPVLGNVADAVGLRLALVLVLGAVGAMSLLAGAVGARQAGPA